MLVIIDYGVGNLASIKNMIKKGGNESVISGSPEDIRSASKLLLPGMGHFDNCMKKLRQSGLLPLIEERVFKDRVPILGICVGLQMFMASSDEGNEPGLAWVKGKTVKFNQDLLKDSLKIPNMGWLEVLPQKQSFLLKDISEARFYFAHSYCVEPDDRMDILATAEYGYPFTVGIEQGNIVGVQFHPEKSHRFGMKLLKNFSELY